MKVLWVTVSYVVLCDGEPANDRDWEIDLGETLAFFGDHLLPLSG
jgi:hypothetical protein